MVLAYFDTGTEVYVTKLNVIDTLVVSCQLF